MKNNIEYIKDNQEFYSIINELFENNNKLFIKLLIKNKRNRCFVAIYSKDLFIQKNITDLLESWVGEDYREEIEFLMGIKNIQYGKFLIFGLNILYEK